MAFDASIPLSVNTAGPDLGRMMSLADMSMRLRQNSRAEQAQNALREALGQPGAIGPDGTIAPNVLAKVTAIDPKAGMELQQNALRSQQARAALDLTKTEQWQKKAGLIDDVRGSALTAYEQALKTLPEPQAIEAGQRALNEGLAGLEKGGIFSEQERDSFQRQFDPKVFQARALQYNEWKKLQHQERTDKRQEEAQKERERHDRATEERMAAAVASKGDGTVTGWQVLTDSKKDEAGNPIQYRYNARTAEATTLDGKPYTPAGASKLSAKGPADESGALSPESLKTMAEQYLAGDKSALQNLGRGAQGSKNLVALRGEIAKQMGEKQMSGADIAAKMAEFEGIKAGERTLSTRSANIEMAVNEADQFADLALMASKEVSRTNYIRVNRALQSWEKNTGDPKIRAFGAANNSFINAYARAVSPSGTPTVSDKEHAREMLETADSQAQYEAVITQLKKEMAAAQKSPGVVRDELRKAVTGDKDKPATVAEPGPPKPSAAPAADKFEVGKVYRDAKGNRARYEGAGKWAEVKD